MFNEIKGNNNKEQKFYNKKWFIWIMLIFVTPVGIFLMYRNKMYDKPARIVLSVIFMIIFIVMIPKGETDQASNTNKVENITQKETKQEPVKTKEEIEQEEAKKKAEIEKKKIDEYLRRGQVFSGTLANEFRAFSVASQNSNLDDMKIRCDNIVFSSKEFKKLKAPDKYKKTQENINKACDIYINVYGNLIDKALANENEWLDNSLKKLNEANNLIKEATKDFNNKQG